MIRRLGLTAVIASIGALAAVPGTATASGTPQGPPAAPITAPFQQCAAVYQDPSCGYLIDITGATTSHVLVDPTVGFYEGQDDVLVGVQNDSGAPVSSIHVGVPGTGYGSFGFDGDGLCTPGGGPVPADCPFGPTGDPGDYFGPDAQLVVDPNPCTTGGTGPCTDDGTVNFPTPLQPGQYTYFSLEAPFVGASVVTGTQNDIVFTALDDGTQPTNVQLNEAAPKAITDTATIKGANASTAGGTVTYTVYSDPACTVPVASGGTKPVTNGTAAASDPFGATLPTNARYYIQAMYSGDGGAPTHNDATTTSCGDETITFGTAPVKPAPVITTTLVAATGAAGAQLTVPTGTPVHDTASVTGGGVPQNGRVTYYIYSDSACATQVKGVNLGSGPSSAGIFPPSNTVTVPNGTYYFQAIYSGNATYGAARSTCTEVLTVEPPCNCSAIFSYLNAFHIFGAGSTRIEFNLHAAIRCTTGAGTGCKGTLTVTAPAGAQFIDSTKAKNGATGLRLVKSTATLPFSCAGPCAARTVQPAYTLQYLAFKRVKVKRKHHKAVFKLVPNPLFLPSGRAGKSFTVTATEVCNGVTTVKKLTIVFDKHGQVSYKSSDLNGDGAPDGRQLTDITGFV